MIKYTGKPFKSHMNEKEQNAQGINKDVYFSFHHDLLLFRTID